MKDDIWLFLRKKTTLIDFAQIQIHNSNIWTFCTSIAAPPLEIFTLIHVSSNYFLISHSLILNYAFVQF